jgi:hypothetical protein
VDFGGFLGLAIALLITASLTALLIKPWVVAVNRVAALKAD